jgi:hypothetical protein
MKTGLKIALGAAAVLALVGTFAYQKATKITETFGAMTMKIVGISDVTINLTNFSFYINVYFHIPTSDDFTVSGFGVASLKRLKIYLKGQYLGEASVNISDISIPSNNELIIHDLPVNVATSQVLQNIMTIENIKLSDLNAVATFDVAGNEFEITT